MKNIFVVTGTRAEYGLLHGLLKEIKSSKDANLQLIVTGSHLSPAHGLSIDQIISDGFEVTEKIDLNLTLNTKEGICKSISIGVEGFSRVFSKSKPDIVVILGDRYELMACAMACLIHLIPIAHIHGGERTEGAIDEAIRHSLTKMSHVHFVANEEYRRRVIQLGESPKRVYNFGAPGLDRILELRYLNRDELTRDLGITFANKNFLITYHPTTLEKANIEEQFDAFLGALTYFTDTHFIFTYPNADAESEKIISRIESFRNKYRDNVYAFKNLGQIRYLSLMKECDIVVGNSSSGIIEAPFLKKPSVDIGIRQKGRMKASSIICSGNSTKEIVEAIEKAISPDFKEIALNSKSHYGVGGASKKILTTLLSLDYSNILHKEFFNLNTCENNE